MLSGQSRFRREQFDPGFLELNFHLRSGMLLERDDAILPSAGIFINHLAEDMVIDLDGHVRTIGDDDQIIEFPAHRLDQGGERLGVLCQRCRFADAAVGGVGDLEPAWSHVRAGSFLLPPTRFARLVVDGAGVGVSRIEIGLVSADVFGLGPFHDTAELHARIAAVRNPPELHPQFKVGVLFRMLLGIHPDQVGLDVAARLGCLHAVNRSILDRPEVGKRIPAAQVLAVEHRAEALGVGLGQFHRPSQAGRIGGTGEDDSGIGIASPTAPAAGGLGQHGK